MAGLTRVRAWLSTYLAPFTGAITRLLDSKLSDTVSVKDFGAVGDGVTDDTVAIQAAIDAMEGRGGGTVTIPAGKYILSPSRLQESYDNSGVAIAASTCCIVLRPRVRLVGAGPRQSHLHINSATTTLIYMIAPNGSAIEDLELSGTYSQTNPGAGHGVIQLNGTGGLDKTNNGLVYRNLYIHDVGSYGLGINNGAPRNATVENILIENTGADGIDTKSRDVDLEPSGNRMHNITVRNHGLRLDGSTGIDIRGIWNLSGITVVDYGSESRTDLTGIRFRTKNDSPIAYVAVAGRRSTLSGFFVRGGNGIDQTKLYGVTSGSDDVDISNGTIVNVGNGLVLVGNAQGTPDRNIVAGVHLIGCQTRGIWVGTGTNRAQIRNCLTYSCGEGFRDNGNYSSFIGCTSENDTTSFTSASGSVSSNYIVGCNFGNDFVSLERVTTGRVAVRAKGDAADIDLILEPKGNGNIRMGSFTSASDAPIVGYILVRELNGTVRKLAVVA